MVNGLINFKFYLSKRTDFLPHDTNKLSHLPTLYGNNTPIAWAIPSYKEGGLREIMKFRYEIDVSKKKSFQDSKNPHEMNQGDFKKHIFETATFEKSN